MEQAKRCPACEQSNRPERRFCAACGTSLAGICPACGARNEVGERFCGRCGAAVEAPDVPAGPATPATFAAGRYQVRRLLGEGARKRVYLATDTRLERDVALGLVKTEGLDAAGLARVHQEARAMARLGDHPNIVTVFDIGEDNGQPFIVSQYVAGGSVDDLIARADQGRLPIEDTVRIGEQVCRALEHAHERGVIHRDLKPSNVWLAADGTAKLGDFGLALARDRSRLTIEGMMVGTVAYMSPEQALGRALDARSDLYALGAMLYEMVAGRPPFLGDDAVAIVSQHINTTPVAPSWHNRGIPRGLEALILSLLEKTPEGRPGSASAVREALAATDTTPVRRDTTSIEANPLDRLAGGVFVGRAREIEELRARVEDARTGRGCLALLAGEPGIGKTRVANELATYARMGGFQVLWGRCAETGGAPAYWPWVQVIRAYLHERDVQNVIAEMGSAAIDIAQVVSDVRERLPDLPKPAPLDPEQARFRLFDSVTTFLKNAASQRPLMLVLDDLHWADASSLLLLHFLAREMERSRLVVVGTFRDVELGREHPLFQTLGELTREPVTRRTVLRGLSEAEVGRYIEMTAGTAAPAALVAAVHGETEGNPFFMGEVVRLLAEEHRLSGTRPAPDWKPTVPQSVREVVARRLDRLSKECNRVLSVASVAGREFALETLELATELQAEPLLEAVDEAIAARVVVKVAESVGRYRFSHALVRETLYEDLSVIERMRLHERIGEALETVHRLKPERHLAELAYHFMQAAEGGRHVDKAIAYSRRAAARAVAQLAYEEAARLYRRTLELRAADEPERAEMLLELGEAERRAGNVQPAQETFREAAAIARRLGAAELLARAALAHAGPGFVFGQHDEVEVALLEQALEALGDAETALRAKVLARLAMALYFFGDRERCNALSSQAVEMARRVGDGATLAYALYSRHAAVWGPRNLEERLAIAGEIVRLATASGDRELAGRGRHLRIADSLEHGDLRAVYRDMETQARLADELKQPLFEWYRGIYQTMRALLEGRFDDADRLSQETLVVGQRASPDAMETFGVESFIVNRERGQLEEIAAGAAAFVEAQPTVPGWRAALASISADLGRETDARRELETLVVGDSAAVPEDPVWLASMNMLAETAAALGDVPRAEVLYRALLPYAERNVIVGAGVACRGSVSLPLGLLAAASSRWQDAADHFEAALAVNARMGARPWVAYTELGYARMLLARAEPGDQARALRFLDRALETARELGMKLLTEKALALRLGAQGVDRLSVERSIDTVASAVEREQPNLRPHAAPDGTVTILFTDIEGSTAMTERLGDARAQEVLREHAAIIREQVRAQAGFEVKSAGDGFMVVFASARRAILCAIAIQRAIAGYSAAHPEEPILVRIGLHTGEVIREADDFFGKNVILAARITDEARGGEILVSSVLHELTESAGDIPFGEPRSVEMKGIAGVRTVYEVQWGGTSSREPVRREADSGYVFRCEGEYWTLAFEGSVCRLRDAKGLHHIAHLLQHAGEQFEARVLVGGGDGVVVEVASDDVPFPALGDGGAVLDAKAKDAYRHRLADLREELEEAERFNDSGRADRAREELEFLSSQLSAAVGLGGRDRKLGSAAERARLTVTKRIKDALGRIRDSHPALGAYLVARIKTGHLCTYAPDPARPVSWTL